MFFLRLGIIFLGIVNKTHPFDLNVIATTAWIAGSLYCGDSPRHCAMFPRATLSSDSILRSHQDNFSRGSSPSGIIYNIYITLLTLYNIIDKIYNIYPTSYCNSAARNKPQYTSSPLPPVRRPPELLQFCTAPFTAAAHVLMRTFLPFPPTIMNIFGRSGAFYSQGRTHNALML